MTPAPRKPALPIILWLLFRSFGVTGFVFGGIVIGCDSTGHDTVLVMAIFLASHCCLMLSDHNQIR